MAAINFPSSPSNGDTHVVDGVTYTYNSAETKWKTTINSNAFLPLSGGTVSGNIVLGGELQHSGDTDTKITFGTDTINLDTGGTTRATVDSSGRLGIGTTSPSALLHIAKSGGNAKLLVQRSNTAANTDDYGSIVWQSSAGNNNALIGAARHSAENDAYMFFSTASGGTLQEVGRFTHDGDLRFNSGFGSVATAYGVRAWVNFDGTGTAAIKEDGGISSFTDVDTGKFRISFSTTMPDANYCPIMGICNDSYAGTVLTLGQDGPTGSMFSKTTTQLQFRVSKNGGDFANVDVNEISLAIIR